MLAGAGFPWGSYHHRTGPPAPKTLFPVVELDSIGTYYKRKELNMFATEKWTWITNLNCKNWLFSLLFLYTLTFFSVYQNRWYLSKFSQLKGRGRKVSKAIEEVLSLTLERACPSIPFLHVHFLRYFMMLIKWQNLLTISHQEKKFRIVLFKPRQTYSYWRVVESNDFALFLVNS